MTPKPVFKGCGGPSTVVVYRGFKRRLFACDDCLPGYGGNGKSNKYATDVAGQKKAEGVHYGPARTCGHAIDGDE